MGVNEVSLAVKNPQEFVGLKPNAVLCFGEIALLVLPKNVRGVTLSITDAGGKVVVITNVRKILKLPYPEKL